jgi:hypothetical protein
MKILFTNFFKNPFFRIYCFIVYSLFLIFITYYYFEYNNEYYFIVYNFSNNGYYLNFYDNIVENEGTSNIVNKIIHGNYYPSHFVKPDTKIPYSLFNGSKNLNYSNSTTLKVLDLRLKLEQECRLKLEKDYLLRLEEYDLHLAK